MENASEYRFKIDAYTPETIPMSRLAEYMHDLAALLGEKEHVHFVRLEEGSTRLVQRIDRESVPKVQARGAIDVIEGEGPEDALRAFKALDRRLAADNALGHIYQDDGAEIIHFPGCEKAKPPTFGAFNQPGSLDGLLIKIGFFESDSELRYHDEITGDLFTQADRTLDLLLTKVPESNHRLRGCAAGRNLAGSARGPARGPPERNRAQGLRQRCSETDQRVRRQNPILEQRAAPGRLDRRAPDEQTSVPALQSGHRQCVFPGRDDRSLGEGDREGHASVPERRSGTAGPEV